MGAQDVFLPTAQGWAAFASSLLSEVVHLCLVPGVRKEGFPSLPRGRGSLFYSFPIAPGVRVFVSSLLVGEGFRFIWEKDSGKYTAFHICQLSGASCFLPVWATKGAYLWLPTVFLLRTQLRPVEKIFQVRAIWACLWDLQLYYTDAPAHIGL